MWFVQINTVLSLVLGFISEKKNLRSNSNTEAFLLKRSVKRFGLSSPNTRTFTRYLQSRLYQIMEDKRCDNGGLSHTNRPA